MPVTVLNTGTFNGGATAYPAAAAATGASLVVSKQPRAILGAGDNCIRANYGGGTQAAAFAVENALIAPQALNVFRQYYGPGAMPTTIDQDMKDAVGMGMSIVVGIKPAYNPPSATERTAIGVFLDSCVAYGMRGAVTTWHEPVAEGLTAVQFQTMTAFHSATIRARYPYIYCGQCNTGIGSLANYEAYFQAGVFDWAALDYYCGAYVAGSRMDTFAAYTDSQGVTNFSVLEMGVYEGAPTSQANGTAYWGYIQSFMTSRLSSGLGVGAVCHFTANPPDTVSGELLTGGDYQIPLFQSMVTAMTP